MIDLVVREPTHLDILLEAVVGSRAYGLDHKDSDIDRFGIFKASNSDLLGLHWTQNKESYVTHEPGDATYHEVAKFIRLALKCNPTVTELLWMNEYSATSPAGNLLLEHRKIFLSTKYVRDAYGYARQQVDRLITRNDGTFSSSTKNRTAKHGRHTFRLLMQGLDLLETGKLQVRLTPHNAAVCKEAGELAATNINKFIDNFKEAEMHFRNAYSILPSKPDEKTANDLLLAIRFGDV